jgi:hypothetical protein
MPHLSDLWSEVSQQRKDVAFISVNIGDSRDVVAGWWKDERFAHEPALQQGDAVSRAFGVQAYPTNYVLGPDGRVLWRGVGWDEDALRAALASTAR